MLASAQVKFRSEGLIVVGVDEAEGAAQAQAFRSKYHLPYQVVVDSGSIQGQYSVNALPVHVFIGRDGTVKNVVAGEISRALLLADIRKIL